MSAPATCRRTLDLRACDVDVENRWKPSAIFIAQQEMGEQHCRDLHCSHQELGKHNAFFVLMRQRLDFVAYPAAADIVEAETWIGPPQRTIFPRFYSFRSPSGALYGTVSTYWMLCSLLDRRILNPADILKDYPQPAHDSLSAPGKLRFSGPITAQALHRVAYSDMDYNGHANNTKYVDWCCDLFDISSYQHRELSYFQINYVSELRGGEEVQLDLSEQGDHFMVQGQIPGENRTVFQAAGSWRPR